MHPCTGTEALYRLYGPQGDDNGTRRGWEVSSMPLPRFTPGKDRVPIVQEAGWAPGPFWTGVETPPLPGILSPDHPAHSQSLYRRCHPAHTLMKRPLLYITIKPDIITLWYHIRNKRINKTFKMLQSIGREKVKYFIILSLAQQYNCFRVNSKVKKRSLLQFTFYFVVTSPDGWNCWPKHVVYVVNKWMLQHLWCSIGRTAGRVA